MRQDVRFCRAPGGRVAYATAGEGPPLVLPTWWASHVEYDWGQPGFRAFLEPLAERFTVVRYDRLGVGLSDRERPPESLDLHNELDVLEALVEHLGLDRFALLGISCGGCIATAFAGRHPDAVTRMALYGAYADGARIGTPAEQASLTDLVAAQWGLGSRDMAEVFLGDATGDDLREFARFQRATTDAPTAAALLGLVYRLDARAEAPRVRAPTFAVHRRGDRAVPYPLGVELASLVPGARLISLDGTTHVPWHGERDEVVAALAEALAVDARPAPERDPETLSAREMEVLRLVADGLSDGEIAARLALSPHTVHRHVANARLKLREPSRAAAVAHAARRGLL